MAPKTLSLSSLPTLSPLFLSPRLITSTRTSLTFQYPKPTPILCKSVQPRTHEQTPVSAPEPDGAGAAAPTRGDIFLERQKALADSAKVLSAIKRKKKREKVGGSTKASRAVPSCYGCGAPLQILETDAPGYVDPPTYELKKKHHQLRTVLCGRCRLLSHGHMITAVGGNGGYSGGKQFVTAEELREKLSHLRHENALIVKLVDIVDFNGSFLVRVRDLAGANPIILVVTKVDLLPKGTNFHCVGDWVVEATMKKKLNVVSVHLTSSKSLVGIAGVVSEIQREKKGRDVYILGSANVGKSAFINALLKMMSYKDPVAAAAQKYRPIQSAVPGTTLGPIQIDAFMGGGKVYDTPGVHLHHRQAAVVHSEDLPSLAPRSRLRGRSFPVCFLHYFMQHQCMMSFSVILSPLPNQNSQALPQTCLTFYGPKALQIHLVPTVDADEFYQREVGNLLTPPTGKERGDNWMGLETQRQLQIEFEDARRPARDVAISGLGWIAVEPIGRSPGVCDSNLEEADRELLLVVHVPKPVEIFVRPPLPVGKGGEEWYQYREFTEKELEVRPKWHF
ncbi:hypothetical protein RHMOL_Rhmol03G0191700 [Rhododendron molle]|uniref:Uncharacterized protein n=1 Tax=Rhododendron molle TaxID=49168 RepID=A0ACC0PHF6_RHOML|nr:hypothetical protein RHMOL_Rhmol03G0191700 [Rhododendron molle]